MNIRNLLMASAMLVTGWAGTALGGEAQGWITHPSVKTDSAPIVLSFQRQFDLDAVPPSFPVQITADNRFILFVNGQRVASGPSMGDVANWRISSLDLAPYLQPGRNILTAQVWNFVKPAPVLPPDPTKQQKAAFTAFEMMHQTGPVAQQSVATGFWLRGPAGISTDAPGWQTAIDPSRSAGSGQKQVRRWYYAAGAPETLDASIAPGDWTNAVPAPEAAARTLVADRLPQQRFSPVPAGKVVRTDLPAAKGFPTRPVTVPANSKVTLLLQREAMVSAYPELALSGGAGAQVKLTYAEALYDEKFIKADRNLIGDRKPVGITDSITADGRSLSFMPLWWRTWRYLEIEVTTKDAPLTLEKLSVFETGYPFQKVAKFESSDPELDRIWHIGWRTAEVDAHETYMDTSFWEQLQYAGDTRLQMLISYAVSGDPRLAEQAIDAFASSNTDGGLIEAAYPTRRPNAIAPFSLLWVGMLHDWWMEQPDPRPVTRNLDRMRTVLDWFEKYRSPRGLLTRNPQWNFIDWAGQTAVDRDKFPSYSKESNESCLMSVTWLGALDQGAALEAALGDPDRAASFKEKASALRTAIRQHCWNAERGLFADNPDLDVFSQHTNALAVLYDVATPEQAPAILDRIMAPGKGIDAPEGMFTTSYYFAWYLIRAFDHAGLSDRYPSLLKTWRDLLALNYTTWPEERGNTRSDSHAWSAHPTADLLGIVAGIRSAAPGYAALRVEPHLGSLTRLDATAATPHGPVKVRYRLEGGWLEAEIDRPANLPGSFIWNGQSHPLNESRTRLRLRAAP